MKLLNSLSCLALAVALNLSLVQSGFSQDAALLCASQGDPVAEAPFNLVDSYCIPTESSIGNVGDPSNILGGGTFPANDAGQLDVFIVWEPDQFDVGPGEAFTYSSSLSWSSNKPDARVREWVGNFIPVPPQAFNITDTNAGLPAEMVKTATSATVTNRAFDDSAFPPIPIGRYHIQITGLDAGEMVTFSKNGAGGHVVPEPSSAGLAMLGITCLSFLRWRREGSRLELSRLSG